MPVMRQRNLTGSAIGGIPETQEMLDYCAAKNIVSDIEMIPIDDIAEAYQRTVKGDVRYRFVIDIAALKSKAGVGVARVCTFLFAQQSRSGLTASAILFLGPSVELSYNSCS